MSQAQSILIILINICKLQNSMHNSDIYLFIIKQHLGRSLLPQVLYSYQGLGAIYNPSIYVRNLPEKPPRLPSHGLDVLPPWRLAGLLAAPQWWWWWWWSWR